MTETRLAPAVSLAQRLAVMTQIHLPGTVGRILKQNRDLESIAPYFQKSGLVRFFRLPDPFSIRVSGIATGVATKPVWGGLLYAAAAVRVDLAVENNVIRTTGQDSACEIDDIDYEDQSKRFQLIGIRQAYEMADAALHGPEKPHLILLDCPLVLNRSMVPVGEAAEGMGYRRAFEATTDIITRFWSQHQAALFPWNPDGAVVASLATERFGAIVYVAQQDLRTAGGRQHLLSTEDLDDDEVAYLVKTQGTIAGIGDRRFLQGILEKQTRTAAFRMNVKTPRMEPAAAASHGVIGFHVRSVDQAVPQFVQLIGDSPGWNRERLDRLAGEITCLTVANGRQPIPIPLFLAGQVAAGIRNFVDDYRRGVEDQIRKRQLEHDWLTGIDEFNPEQS